MTDRLLAHPAESITRTAELAQISFVILLGAFILFGTAIAPIDAAHNAAHDSRHSFAFPCH